MRKRVKNSDVAHQGFATRDLLFPLSKIDVRANDRFRRRGFSKLSLRRHNHAKLSHWLNADSAWPLITSA